MYLFFLSLVILLFHKHLNIFIYNEWKHSYNSFLKLSKIALNKDLFASNSQETLAVVQFYNFIDLLSRTVPNTKPQSL